MGLTRNSTVKGELVVGIDRTTARLSALEVLTKVGRESELKGDLEAKLGRTIPVSLFFHRNRNGKLAVATGVEPDVWPEDMKPPILERGQI